MDTLHAVVEKLRLQASALVLAKRDLERQARALGDQIKLIEARVAGMEEAAEILGRQSEPAKPHGGVTINYLTPRRHSRPLTGHWRDILELVGEMTPFTHADLTEAAGVVGHPVNSESLRSQMSGYKKNGIVDADGKGNFTLTAIGREAVGIVCKSSSGKDPNENEAHNGQAVSASSADKEGAPTPSLSPSTPNHPD